MEIIENIKEDARLKDQEYIDIMNAFSKFNNLKDKIKTTIIYREIAKVKKQKEPPTFISLREKSHICGACGRGFTTKNGLRQHNERDICNKINQFAQFSVKEGKHHHDFYHSAKRVKNRTQKQLLELEKEQNKKAAERQNKWMDYTETQAGVWVPDAIEELVLDPEEENILDLLPTIDIY
ncbi:MAG: hypothetical protein ACR2M9_04020 [Cyanophyceae cyanobacterium]